MFQFSSEIKHTFIAKMGKTIYMSIIYFMICAICLLLIKSVHGTHTEYEDLGFYPQKEHSLMRPYQGTGMTIPNWDIIGHTIVSSNFIRITPDQQSRHGGLWNKVVCFNRF